MSEMDDSAVTSALDIDTDQVDVQDQWTQVLMVRSAPRTRAQIDELLAGNECALHPVEHDKRLQGLHAIGQIRALWYGSVAMEPVQEVGEGDFVWSDDPEIAQGLPVVEWSTGLRTIVPFYDWTLDYSGIFSPNPEAPKPRDKWQIHVYSLPIKPSHAITYHDCQGQTCQKVVLGGISRLFSANMLYVGLSRAPTLEAVVLSDDFKEWHIKAHPHALDFFDQIHGAETTQADETDTI